MKKITMLLKLSLAFPLLLALPGCFKDSITQTYTIMRPVYEKKSVVLSNVKSGNPSALKSPGKIYIQGNYLFINEVDKGVHVFDNRNPVSPHAVSFINIPGNVDIAVKGNTLYADMYSDLLAIDIADPLNVKLAKNISGVFPERNYGGNIADDDELMIVNWIMKDTTVTIQENNDFGSNCPNCAVASFDSYAYKGGAAVPGIGGSMARLSIVNNYLYAVNSNALGVYNITDPLNPESKGVSQIGAFIETIYPFGSRLFIGSATGMFIYNISDPSSPQREGIFSHARACDPVIADDQYAFVTLRTGTACMGVSNQLDVLNVSQVLSPQLLKTYALTNPYGLAKDGNLLFVCDGKEGLKIYDATNVEDLKLKHHFTGMDAYDAIAWNNKLILVASNGLYQYDYSNPDKILLLSAMATASK